jgi:hypothetical protein
VLRTFLSLVASLLITSGCQALDDVLDEGRGDEPELSFQYEGVGGEGMIDQTLGITNSPQDVGAVPTLSFVALDDDGEPLETVEVGTIYGSDRGLVAAPADFEVFDILTFHGQGAHKVEDVEVTMEGVETFADAGSAYPEVEYFGTEGEVVPDAFAADIVRVDNPGSSDYAVRLVGIEWGVPPPGRPQQALRSEFIGDVTEVAAGESADIVLPARLRGQFGSLKVYISTAAP